MSNAYIIDAKAREVRHLVVDGLEDWQKAVAGDKKTVYVEPISFGWLPHHTILVDEEGRVRNPLPYGFKIKAPPHQMGAEQIFGNGLVMSRTEDGGFASPTLDIENIKAMVDWWGEP